MKVVVTGATGHLGRSVVWELSRRAAQIAACSRSGALPECPANLTGPGDAQLIRVAVDIAHETAVDALARHFEPGCALVHLAAWHPPSTATTDSNHRRSLLEVNTLGTLRALDAARRGGGPGVVVYASTFEVYGAPEVLPITEDHPTRPLTDYGATKLSGEDHVMAFGAEEGVRVVCLRMPAIYGPGEQTARALPNFLRAVMRAELPSVQGDGQDLRDQLYVADAARAVSAALAADQGGIFNVSDGAVHSIAELATTALRLASMPGPPAQRPRAKPRFDYHMSIARAQQVLGFTPTVTLEQGMAAELRWLRAR